LDSDITESALLALSVEILLEKGGIPVGEVGKLLQVRVMLLIHTFVLGYINPWYYHLCFISRAWTKGVREKEGRSLKHDAQAM
jgi:hypothetical protein